MVYQKVYASGFLVEFIIVTILYVFIYRSIIVRRAWKAKRKSTYLNNCPDVVAEETQLTTINGDCHNVNNGGADGNNGTNVVMKKNPRMSTSMRDKTLYANVKTAAMLFVVTVFFVISFVPSWLMGLKLIAFNRIVFYLYFVNNVCNPIIYAFMNRTFREDLVQLVKNCLRGR